MKPIRTGPPRTGPCIADAAPSIASAGVPESAFKNVRRPISRCSGVRTIQNAPLDEGLTSPRTRGPEPNLVSPDDGGPGVAAEQCQLAGRFSQEQRHRLGVGGAVPTREFRHAD